MAFSPPDGARVSTTTTTGDDVALAALASRVSATTRPVGDFTSLAALASRVSATTRPVGDFSLALPPDVGDIVCDFALRSESAVGLPVDVLPLLPDLPDTGGTVPFLPDLPVGEYDGVSVGESVG